MKIENVTINSEQELFIIPCHGGYSCLGFTVCRKRLLTLAWELTQRGVNADAYSGATIGTLEDYRNYETLIDLAREHNAKTGYRFECELSRQLKGLEGKRVEVVTSWGETQRFWVGKSTGFIPCHLQISRRDSSGGPAVCGEPFQTVRIISHNRN